MQKPFDLLVEDPLVEDVIKLLEKLPPANDEAELNKLSYIAGITYKYITMLEELRELHKNLTDFRAELVLKVLKH
jgi:hypothetical protein